MVGRQNFHFSEMGPFVINFCFVARGKILYDLDSAGKSHEYTANLDKRIAVAMVVDMETTSDIGYGPGGGPYPKSTGIPMATGILLSRFAVFP